MSEKLSKLLSEADQGVSLLAQALATGESECLPALARKLMRVLSQLRTVDASEWHSPEARLKFLTQMRADVSAQMAALSRAQMSVQRELSVLLPRLSEPLAYSEQGLRPQRSSGTEIIA